MKLDYNGSLTVSDTDFITVNLHAADAIGSAEGKVIFTGKAVNFGVDVAAIEMTRGSAIDLITKPFHYADSSRTLVKAIISVDQDAKTVSLRVNAAEGGAELTRLDKLPVTNPAGLHITP